MLIQDEMHKIHTLKNFVTKGYEKLSSLGSEFLSFKGKNGQKCKLCKIYLNRLYCYCCSIEKININSELIKCSKRREEPTIFLILALMT